MAWTEEDERKYKENGGRRPHWQNAIHKVVDPIREKLEPYKETLRTVAQLAAAHLTYKKVLEREINGRATTKELDTARPGFDQAGKDRLKELTEKALNNASKAAGSLKVPVFIPPSYLEERRNKSLLKLKADQNIML